MPDHDALGFHGRLDALTVASATPPVADVPYTYRFENFFHPFVGQLIERLNTGSIADLLDPVYLGSLSTPFFGSHYVSSNDPKVRLESHPKEVDVRPGGPYANYNWELLFHVPVGVAVHLSTNQRFAEAQRWFHYVFDPTSDDTVAEGSDRFWRFLGFRGDHNPVAAVDGVVDLLTRSTTELDPVEADVRSALLEGFAAARDHPFDAHLIAATRPVAYQYWVVMRYLDNLIAWGDALFREDTGESINEATQRYVLAANILGPRPRREPRTAPPPPVTFADIRRPGRADVMAEAMLRLEDEMVVDLDRALPSTRALGDAPIDGLARTDVFCIPANETLLGYWDTVADRLFKVRNCMNIEGVVRPLALFDPPIDPGLLVKAAAAGIDAGAIVGAADQAQGAVRASVLVQKALEMCAEVRALGASLLAAIEKGEADRLVTLRQGHEVALHELVRDVRFLQWKQTEAVTDAIASTREAALERHRHYDRLLRLDDPNQMTFVAPWSVSVTHHGPEDPPRITEATFAEAYADLVKQYERRIPMLPHPGLRRAGGSAGEAAGSSSPGRLRLTVEEDAELNTHLPESRDMRLVASRLDTVASVLTLIPELEVDLQFWGLGIHGKITGGDKLAQVSRIAADIFRTEAAWEQDQAGMAARTAGYERRVEEWIAQRNSVSGELMQLGRQLISATIAEDAARKEYANVIAQAEQGRAVEKALRERFADADLYGWMQGQLTRLHHEYYRFAFDTARKAELAVKRELRRPEVDAIGFITTDHWDGGRAGLLAGDKLHLDLKRLELAHLEADRREYELTTQVSLRQLDPTALLRLRATGSCDITIPESRYDLDAPGHYMRRLRHVSVSIPAVTGPHTPVTATLTLLRSTLRTSPTATSGYARVGDDLSRFEDQAGMVRSVVTSTGHDDDGLFDGRGDPRPHPFEGAGAISSWRLELPTDFRQFDYDTIADVVVQVRYTAREGGALLRAKAVEDLEDRVEKSTAVGSSRLVPVRQEHPDAWARFRGADLEGDPLAATVRVRLDPGTYPFWAQDRRPAVSAVKVIARSSAPSVSAAGPDGEMTPLAADPTMPGIFVGDLNGTMPEGHGHVEARLSTTDVDDLWFVVTWHGSGG